MRIKQLTVLSTLVFTFGLINTCTAADTMSGQALAFDRNKGNCLACHAIPNDPAATSPGNIGPTLVSMKARYPSRDKLRARIWDNTAINPNTSMPPFGKNKILTEPEIDLVTDYILGM